MTLEERAVRVRMLVMDVDGVMTDGGMYYGEHGEEFKKFNTRDGHGIGLLHGSGIGTAIVTSEQTAIVDRRAGQGTSYRSLSRCSNGMAFGQRMCATSAMIWGTCRSWNMLVSL
jgi:hypothetical protein